MNKNTIISLPKCLLLIFLAFVNASYISKERKISMIPQSKQYMTEQKQHLSSQGFFNADQKSILIKLLKKFDDGDIDEKENEYKKRMGHKKNEPKLDKYKNLRYLVILK